MRREKATRMRRAESDMLVVRRFSERFPLMVRALVIAGGRSIGSHGPSFFGFGYPRASGFPPRSSTGSAKS